MGGRMARERGDFYENEAVPAYAPGEEVRRRKQALIERDSLGRELSDTLRALYSLCERKPNSRQVKVLWKRAVGLRQTIEHKYHTYVFFRSVESARRRGVRLTTWSGRPREPWKLTERDLGFDDEAPMRARTNWTLPEGTNEIMDLPPGPRRRSQVAGPRDGRPPTLTVEVDMRKITLHDLAYLTERFRHCVRHAWEGRPDELLRPPSLRTAAELAFIRTTSDVAFARHLRRYDLHTHYGLSFRLIAALEHGERRGHPVPVEPKSRRVGSPVRGEDAVAKSVRLIHEAIHREHYRADRGGAKAGTAGSRGEPFSCPTHAAGDCGGSCPHLRRWLATVEPMLPSPTTGRLRGERPLRARRLTDRADLLPAKGRGCPPGHRDG